jgi:uncharacterized surface protein with fasciclin (FAS1) repeats
MNFMKLTAAFAVLSLGILCAAPVTVYAQDAAPAAGATAEKDIVDIAMSDPQFSTLVKAVKAAGLVDTLKGSGPFTVFAPTNAAFNKIPAKKLNALLADKAALTKLLTYHVVPGKVMSTDLKPMNAKSVEGSPIRVKVSPAPMVNNAKIVKADIAASNGVIHVIDTVIMPGKGMKKTMKKGNM